MIIENEQQVKIFINNFTFGADLQKNVAARS